MEAKEKKLKAAIMGVIYFLQQEKKMKHTETSLNTWSRSSRETIMRNRMAVQSRAFGLRWVRK